MALDPEKMQTYDREIPGLCDECEQEYSDQIITKSEALMLCISQGHAPCVKACLDAGVDVNCDFEYRYPPLMEAAENGQVDCVKVLIEAGADLESHLGDGVTALIVAAQSGNVDCLQLLLEAGADVNTQDTYGDSALTNAAHSGHVDCVKALIQAGADVNITRGDGETALIYAAQRSHVDCLELLVKAGADVNIQDNDGRTALFYARNMNIAKISLRAGASVNIIDNNGLRALTYNLVRFGPKETVAMLLFTAGDAVNETRVKVPDYLKHEDLKLNLKHLCRETVRKHLINLDPHQHLFGRISQLGLPSLLEEYLLYNLSLDDDETK